MNGPTNNTDPSGLATTGLGVNFGGSLWGATFGFSAGAAVDSAGRTGMYWSGGGGAGLGEGISGGVEFSMSDARTVCDLEGHLQMSQLCHKLDRYTDRRHRALLYL